MKKLYSIIKQAMISLVTNDSTPYPQGQATYNGKPTNFTRLSPYGLISNPPRSSWVLLLSSMAQSAVKFGIASDMLGRKKGLKEGECGLYNTKTKSFILLRENGDIEINASGNVEVTGVATVDVTAPAINLNGAVIVTGSLTASGVVTGSDLTDGTTDYSTHVHGGVDSGPDDTGTAK